MDRIHDITKIDIWYLRQYEKLISLEKVISELTIDSISKEILLEAKQMGFADRQIAHMLGCMESVVYKKRKSLNINRVYKLVDTCAAEFKAQTPYYYSTFEESIQNIDGTITTQNESTVSKNKKIVVLGSGPNRIGQGIEFDYCCVHGVWHLLNVDMKRL